MSYRNVDNSISLERCEVTATWAWTFTLKDSHDKIVPLSITCPINVVFNVLYILVINKEDSSSTNIFVNTHKSGLTILVNLNLNFVGWKVKVLGFQTINSVTGQFDIALCSGTTDITLSESGSCDVFYINMAVINEVDLPLQVPTQGTLPVSVFRQPPSLYRLDINHIFSQERDFIVFVKFKRQLRCYVIQRQRISKYQFPFEIPSATTVNCKVICARRHQIEDSFVCLATISHSQTITFKTFLSLSDTYRLYNLAMEFGSRKVTVNLKPIQFFYRNKSVEYFNVILNHLGGEMRPYLKSNGGEQGSVLNGRLPGLFFSTYLDPNTNLPNPCSFYGPVRLYVQALIMFNPQCNLYFADFYCHYKRHHVTIILTPKLSPCVPFCRQYLTELNIFNNPYLCLHATPQGLFVMANMDVTTEVFYTETINVISILALNSGKFERSTTIGRGYAPPTGLPKNSACTVCNLI